MNWPGCLAPVFFRAVSLRCSSGEKPGPCLPVAGEVPP